MPRPAPSVVRAALRLALFSFVILAMLLGTGLLCAAALTLMYGGPLASPGNLSVGLVCGLVVWLFIAVFHLRKETLTLPAPDPARFMQYSRLLLAEMGYDVQSHGTLQLSTRPRFHSLLLGGGIQVVLNGTQAHVTGPKMCVELLRNRLRVQAHLGIVQQAMRECHRFKETLIKRAELQMRVKPEQFAEVRTNVIEALQVRGEVLCDVHLLVQSETGVPESLFEFQVNPWLEQQKIKSTLCKHFIQLHRPMSIGEVVVCEAV